MKRQVVLLFAFFPVAVAMAQTAPSSGNLFSSIKIEKLNKVVAVDTETVIDYSFSLNPDCTPSGTVQHRIIKKPMHGEISLTEGDRFPTYDSPNVRVSCNTQRVKAAEVHYKPAPGFTGTDRADIVTIYPDGSADRYVYEIIVG